MPGASRPPLRDCALRMPYVHTEPAPSVVMGFLLSPTQLSVKLFISKVTRQLSSLVTMHRVTSHLPWIIMHTSPAGRRKSIFVCLFAYGQMSSSCDKIEDFRSGPHTQAAWLRLQFRSTDWLQYVRSNVNNLQSHCRKLDRQPKVEKTT